MTKVQATSRPDCVWPDVWSNMLKSNQHNAKRYWAIEKPKLHNARKLRAISYIDPEDTEFKDNMKKTQTWSCRWNPLCFATFSISTERLGAHNTILENQDTLARLKPTRIGATQPRDPEDIIAEKAFNSLCHHNLVHAFIPILQAMKKIPDAKATVDKGWGKIENFLAWQVTEVFNKKRDHRKRSKRGMDC